MPGYQKRMKRHKAFMQRDIPTEYLDQQNPLSSSKENIHEGEGLYLLHCANCHGQKGMGEGNSAFGLSPSPALLAYMMHMPMAVDSYMMWTVAEGGARFATDMPAYKKIMPINDIWKIITFMRAGFPKRSTKTK
jgi:mono/diheme cytochrome c family protein